MMEASEVLPEYHQQVLPGHHHTTKKLSSVNAKEEWQVIS